MERIEKRFPIKVNNKIHFDVTSSHCTSSEIIYEPSSKQCKESHRYIRQETIRQQVFPNLLSF